MKIPPRLQPLLEDGIIDGVLKPLRAGKEAEVYIVTADDDVVCAKVYKEVQNRSFHNQALYQEGRHLRNSRRERAMSKHTRFGKKVEEESWQTAEADTLFKLHGAGVRVPTPHLCTGGVLIMELVLDNEGAVAPRLGDLIFSRDDALLYHGILIREIVTMLCAGVVHADLSEYNILLAYDGPVVIDFPQAVDAAANNNARMFLERDVSNLTNFFGRFAPELLPLKFGREIWHYYEKGDLTPELPLTGTWEPPAGTVDVAEVMSEIDDAREEARQKEEHKAFMEGGLPPGRGKGPRGRKNHRRR